MILTNAAISHRSAIFVLVIVMIGAGSWCYVALPREAAPDIKVPYIIVSTAYPNVSPGDIENEITIEIEKKVSSLRDVEEVTSVSAEGASSVVIEFDPKVDLTDARQRVRDKVDEAMGEMPDDVDDPTVDEINLSELPIMNVSISGPVGRVRLQSLAEELEEEVEGIAGVLDATVVGGLEREIRIEIDMDRLQVYDMPLASLLNLIGRENVNVSGGSVDSGAAKLDLRVPSEFEHPEEIFQLVLFVRDGEPVYLTDIARILDGFKDEASRSRINGEETVTLVIQKRAGENIIRIADRIREIVGMRQERAPIGVHYTINFDQSNDIRMMVDDLENNIISGLLLVVGVLFIFISARNSIFIAAAIPLSMCIGFGVLYAAGITLNFVVLFSLILSLGMLVDNAIVIVENIYRHANEGLERSEAARVGTAEVAWPVITSTATTLAAFGPLLFWSGIIGKFMGFLPKTVIVLLLASLFVALVINPTFCAVFLKLDRSRDRRRERTEKRESAFMQFYERTLAWCIRRRWLVVSATVLSYAAIMWTYGKANLGVEFFPESDPSSATVSIKTAEGSSLDATDRVIREIEDAISQELHRKERMLEGLERVFNDAGVDGEEAAAEIARLGEEYKGKKERLWRELVELIPGGVPDRGRVAARLREEVYKHNAGLDDIEFYTVSTGFQAGGMMGSEPGTVNVGSVNIDFVDREFRMASSPEIVERLRERFSTIHGAEVEIQKQEEGPSQGKPINVEVSGEDLDELVRIAEEVKRVIKKIPGIVDLRDDYDSGRPELRFLVDRQRAALAGLSSEVIAETLKAAVRGMELGTYREGDEDYDITLRFREDQRNDLNSILRLRVSDAEGNQVPLSSITRLSYESGTGSIQRTDERRTITVSSDVSGDYNSAKVLAEVQRQLAATERQLPSGYRIAYTGENEEQAEASAFLSRAYVLAIAVISLILITQFNCYSLPFIIIFSVVLSIAGVFIGLLVLGRPFGVIMTGIAMISLAGVVVNNAIVLVDYTERLRRSGMSVRQAIIRAGLTRFRPVMLTAVTTILGLLPMAVGVSVDFRKIGGDIFQRDLSEWRQWVVVGSESAQWWGPMATSIIFGLGIATVLTLVVVPVLYSILTKRRFGLASLDDVAPDY